MGGAEPFFGELRALEAGLREPLGAAMEADELTDSGAEHLSDSDHGSVA